MVACRFSGIERKICPCLTPPSWDLSRCRRPPKACLIVFCDDGLKFGPATRKALAPAGDLVARAAAADRFTGKSGTALDIVAPAGLDLPRLDRHRGRQSHGSEVAGPREARRHRHGADSDERRGGHDLRRLAVRGDEGGSSRRCRARHPAARLCVRPLQDQAQGGRGAAGHGQAQPCGRKPGRGRTGMGCTRGRCRGRGDRARSRQ